MTIRTHLRTLAAAALLALTVAGAAAEHAHAKPPRPADNGVRCAIPGKEVGEPEDLDFYLPGDVISVRDINGEWRYYKCGADGKWRVVGFRPTPADIRHILGQSGPLPVLHEIPSSGPTFGAVAPISGGVLAQP